MVVCTLSITLAFFLLLLEGVLLQASGHRASDTVNIDLKTGVVKGYSRHVSFIVPPSWPLGGHCARQALIRVDVSASTFNTVTLALDYDRPKLWTLHMSKSATADGHDSPFGAKVVLFNRQLKVQTEDFDKDGFGGEGANGAGSRSVDYSSETNGEYVPSLWRIADGVLGKGRTRMLVTLSDGKLHWTSTNGISGSFDDGFSLPSNGTTRTERIYVALNRVVAGNWRNGSGLCNVNVVLNRQEDECSLGTHDCDLNAVCRNSRRSHKCICQKGFEGDGKQCSDKDECRVRNGGCVHLCHNMPGNYNCSCLPGFRLDVDGRNCLDVDECLAGPAFTGCHQGCSNTIGSFECVCNEGFSLAADGKSCVLGSWCKEQGCEHGCEVTRTSHICICRPGYHSKEGKSCTPTCQMGNGGCQHRCTATSDGPICTCHHKYILGMDRKSCAPSCSVSNGGCEKRCHNLNSGVRCSCPTGMSLHSDEKSCLDVDECAVNNGGCTYKCQNNFGSYECLCPVGYKLLPDEKTCTDVDECAVNDTCEHVCVNTPGSYECHCDLGFQKYGITHCGDFNECSVNNGGCQQICINKIGSFDCKCRDGFYLHPNLKDCLSTGLCVLPTYTTAGLIGCQWRHGVEMCHIGCRTSQLSTNNSDSYIFACGHPMTKYGPKDNRYNPVSCVDGNECSDDSNIHTQRFIFTTDKCDLREVSLGPEKVLFDHWKPGMQRAVNNCATAIGLGYVRIECTSYRKLKHQLFVVLPVKEDQLLIKVQIEIILPEGHGTSVPCDAVCRLQRKERYIRRVTSIFRKSIDKELFYLRHDGKDLQHKKQNLMPSKISTVGCMPGFLSVGDKCILCHPGSYYDLEQSRCVPCPSGTYQDAGGQSSCNLCPSDVADQKGIVGAKTITDCGSQCPVGRFSSDGFEPCLPCPLGAYQSQIGRVFCNSCSGGISTRHSGSTSFQDCISEVCTAGSFFDASSKTCRECPIAMYQPLAGQNHCIKCPTNTTTDEVGTINGNDCKSTKCGGYMGHLLGVLQSPNYPGDYPSNTQCTWKISPGKGRRILVVVPEVFLADNVKCTDYLVMRKSHSPYSVTTFQACKNQEQAMAFSARSKKLWIRFKSDGKHNAKGFRIPYVLYNEEYRPLIEDIVRDSRLYATSTHQQILKDWKLLGALMDVIAHPINYYKYANSSRLMFPKSFIRLMTPKVRRFFSYR